MKKSLQLRLENTVGIKICDLFVEKKSSDFHLFACSYRQTNTVQRNCSNKHFAPAGNYSVEKVFINSLGCFITVPSVWGGGEGGRVERESLKINLRSFVTATTQLQCGEGGTHIEHPLIKRLHTAHPHRKTSPHEMF